MWKLKVNRFNRKPKGARPTGRIEMYEFFVEPQSPDDEFARLRQGIKDDMRQLFDEFIEKAIDGLCKDKISSQ